MAARFSKRATFGLALGLLIPEILRKISGALEPYPALLLPAGTGKLALDGRSVTLKHNLVEARRAGEWREIDRAELLDPLPVHYFGELVRGNFGLHDGHWHKLTPPPPPASAEARARTKRWLRARLERMGFDGGALRVVEERYVLQLPSGARRDVVRTSETVYDLD
jgi:hypothetical protein